jgi:hypothetical protein
MNMEKLKDICGTIRAQEISRMLEERTIVLQHPLTLEQQSAHQEYLEALELEQRLNSIYGGHMAMPTEKNPRGNLQERQERLRSNVPYRSALENLGRAKESFYQTLREDPIGRYDDHPALFPRKPAS